VKSTHYEALHYAVFSLHLPVTPHHPVFIHPQSVFFSQSERDHVSHTFKTVGKIIVVYILTPSLLDRRQEDDRFRTE
jgi:hypothetical protein